MHCINKTLYVLDYKINILRNMMHLMFHSTSEPKKATIFPEILGTELQPFTYIALFDFYISFSCLFNNPNKT